MRVAPYQKCCAMPVMKNGFVRQRYCIGSSTVHSVAKSVRVPSSYGYWYRVRYPGTWSDTSADEGNVQVLSPCWGKKKARDYGEVARRFANLPLVLAGGARLFRRID